jgi:ABC-type transport system substrate-binding protein
MNNGWMEGLHAADWTLDPSIFAYRTSTVPSDFTTGWLAQSWEFTDPSTYVIHLRQNVYWQNIAPVNGRQLVASDIVYCYHRQWGGGDGFTHPFVYTPGVASTSAWVVNLTSVTAPDKYTVVFKWNVPNPEFITEQVQATGAALSCIYPPETITQWGNLNDWHHQIGSGPFILSDYVSSSSLTLSKNHNYYGYDERYPQNQLPYVNGIKILIIPNADTALAALRVGKIDVMEGMQAIQYNAIRATNPEMQILPVDGTTLDIEPRNDVAPFKDLRVRTAMQQAINLPLIASTYYVGLANPTPQTLIASWLTGWGWPYSQWPQSLKDEYTYNPTNAKALLAAAGYSSGFSTNIICTSDCNFDLMAIVQSEFADIGIKMSIQSMDPASWNQYVTRNHQQDAIVARNQACVGRVSPMFVNLVKFSTGCYNMVSDPVFDACYPAAMADTNINDIKQVVITACKEVAQQHYVTALVTPNAFNFYQQWLKGYNGQVTAFGLGSNILGFYGARFWIDQTLKASMGH